MRKRVKIALAVVFIAAVGFAAWETLRTHDEGPIYDGKPLSYWIKRSGQPPGAVLHIGAPPHLDRRILPRLDTNAVPYLIEELDRHDSRLRNLYLEGWKKLPGWARKRLPDPFRAQSTRLEVVVALGEVGPGAKAAIPALSRAIRGDANTPVRWLAVESLGRIGIEEQGARVALVEALADRQALVSYAAMLVLAGNQMADGNPTNTLVRLLGDPDNTIRACASNVLRRVGPVAAAKAGVNTNAPGK